jgi:site-specific DNA-methyltransferase (adenine-specific)
VLDFFAGSGTTGAACLEFGREFILIDNNEEALGVMANRFRAEKDIRWVGFEPANG